MYFKYLLKNKLKIVWCTRLARAIDQQDREKIQEEMMGLGPDLASSLEQLYAARETAKERQKNMERSIRKEARRLKDESSDRFEDRDRVRRGPVIDEDSASGWLKGSYLHILEF
ncbi:hypothetical protein MKW98_029476 [Papaver atlanticum]|uniref:Brr2 N-terminal helicase PWI domain-containing protein n=1 Tax=Papaver atlanticum TaxID=357466 RepID=A0AAD4SHG3_9MAGN|nr:hypothetical protein MKW98_029476 [Papaver atlanticum]